MSRIRRITTRIWHWLRALLGDDAYERYLAHLRGRHPDCPPLGRADFYSAELERRWSQVNRCC